MAFLIQIQFTTAAVLWFFPCLLLGLGFAWLMYRRKPGLSSGLKKGLFALRALAVAIIAYLLFAPMIKTIHKKLEKPVLVMVQDNSASIGISRAGDFQKARYSSEVQKLEKKLAENYEIRTFSVGDRVKEGLSFSFDEKLSDIASAFRLINERFAGRNVGAVILATDGIYNRGGNPLYESKKLPAPVFTIALGDTIPKRDLLISNVNYNDVVYLDNQFQLEVSVEAYQCRGSQTSLVVSDRSGVVFRKDIAINAGEFRQTIPVTLLAPKKGIQPYTLRLTPVSRELSLQNNSQTIFPEVIDGKQNVLIIANAPHPDISALKQSIAINKNYRVSTALAADVSPAEMVKASLIILHQLPSVSNRAQNILNQVARKPVLYILGAQSNTSLFSAAQNLLNVNSSGATQEASPFFQADFYGFTLSEAARNKLQQFAPLVVPFGNYGLKSPGSVMMTQRIGKVASGMPLLVFGDEGGHKTGVLAGEGIWRWRLDDFAENNSHEAVDELFSKTVQYLSSRDDNRKFRAYTAKNAFDENEHVILNAELYNDAYELVNTPDVSLSLKNKNGKNYSFLFARTANTYLLDAGILPAGEYTFEGSTRLGNKPYKAGGQFVISEQQTELRQTQADHQLLFSMAKQSGGRMIYPDQLGQLPALIRENENVKTISYEDERFEELVDNKSLFFVILLLLSAEWFVRKRNGEV